MWEIVETLLVQFVGYIPFFIVFILVMNLISDLVFGRD